jgi:arginine-tRNA-protein transferase
MDHDKSSPRTDPPAGARTAVKAALRLADYGECPYLPGRRWIVVESDANALSPGEYERALPSGWRRSGSGFYRIACRDCEMCVPLRLDGNSWRPSPSQRRLISRNSEIKVSILDPGFSEERFELFSRYQASQHGRENADKVYERIAYRAGYCRGFSAAIPHGSSYPERQAKTGLGSAVVEYRLSDSGILVATGYIDILPDGISSVYFAFDPDRGARSLGTWSVGRELQLALELGKRYYYLGFWVPASPKMDYKARFRPFEMAQDGQWRPVRDKSEALSLLRGRRGYPASCLPDENLH